MQWPLAHQTNDNLKYSRSFPLIIINCDINFENKSILPVCRKYFDKNLKFQLMKINCNREQIYDGSKNWPLGTPDFGSFFRYDHMEKAGISYRIEKYQKRSIQLWDNLSLFRITTLEMMIQESNKRIDFNSANFL